MDESPGTGRSPLSTGAESARAQENPTAPSSEAAEPAAEQPTVETERIQHEIEQTREQLGDTVQALAAKTDVKAQATEKLKETKAAVAEKKDELFGKAREASPEGATQTASAATEQVRQNPLPVAAIGAFVAGFVFGRLTKRRRA
jgi:ElaB/YqjD/DUF883 family membrane-anchored ribosome-binding protein